MKDQALYERTEQATFILPTNRTFKAYLKDNNYDGIGTVPVSMVQCIYPY